MASGTIKNNGAVLLWTNTTQTSNFAAQTIPLDLSKYRFVVVFTPSGTGTGAIAEVGGASSQLAHISSSTNTALGTVSNVRTFTATTSGVQFGDNTSAYVGARNTQNANCIPMKIYGIK
jgi:hypothetical protein